MHDQMRADWPGARTSEISLMSIGLVLGARDGLLVLADGRRAQLTWEPGRLNWQGDHEIKMVVVPGAPIAIINVGRAGFGDTDTHVFVEDELAGMDESERLQAPRVMERCRALLTRLDGEFTRPHGVGTSTLVVGYDADCEEFMDSLHLPSIDVDVLDGFESYRVLAFKPPLKSAVALPAEFSVFAEVAHDLTASDDDPRWNEPDYRYQNLDLAEMRPLAIERLRTWLGENEAMTSSDGIGGRWLVTELRPGQPAVVTDECLGPFGDASNNLPI